MAIWLEEIALNSATHQKPCLLGKKDCDHRGRAERRKMREKGMIGEVFHLRDFSNWLLNRGEGGLKMKID